MEYYTNAEIEKLNISSKDMLSWVEETLKHKKECDLPAKISIKKEGHIFYNTMPCIIPYINAAGLKIVNRYPENTPSLNSHIMLYDLSSGQLKAIMDANYITTWRTAAVAVHSIKLFAKSDYKIVSMIGLGEVGLATLKILCDTADKPLTIRLFNYKNRAQSIIDKYKNINKLISFESYDSYEEMVKDSDVVVSAITYAEKDFADESVYKKGCLLVPIHTLGFQACDLTFDKIFGDDYSHINGFKYFNQFKQFNEVCDVLLNNCKGRTNDQERIIAYNIGIALHDLAFATRIYEMIKK